MSQRTFRSRVWDEMVVQLTDQTKDEVVPEDGKLPDRTGNSTVTDLYRYDALQDEAKSLRLLVLLPGSRQDEIACRLYETTLDKCSEPYEALSYAWGKKGDETPIQVNNGTLYIRPNLRSALLNLRQPDKERTIWIDAICINQADTAERSRQVSIIGDIYRGASQTVVWLGESSGKSTPAAFAMLKDIAIESTRLFRATSSVDESSHEQNTVHIVDCPESFLEVVSTPSPLFDRYQNNEAIIHLFESTWWQRAWTIQEITLASRAVIVAGKYSLGWDHFRSGINYGLRIGIWTPILMGIVHDPTADLYLALQQLLRKLRTANPAVCPAQSLLEFLIHCRRHDASDPRDKVYALLGLLSLSDTHKTHPRLPVDLIPEYASSVSDVYSDTARKLILQTGTLDILGSCANPEKADVQRKSCQTLPSWVPDWSLRANIAKPFMYDAIGRPRATHASRHSNTTPRFSGDSERILQLEGYEITYITSLTSPLHKVQFGSEAIPEPTRRSGDGLRILLARIGNAWAVLGSIYEMLMSLVPHLSVYAEWEEFALKEAPTNPAPSSFARSPSTSLLGLTTDPLHALVSRLNATLALGIVPEEEPTDRLAIYWQTLCVGTYTEPPSDKRRKIAMQQHFYTWRNSLKAVRVLHRWRADGKLRPLAFVGFVRKTWNGISEFFRVLEGAYERRLARGANGYLCLVPEQAMDGDKLMLVKGGRVPLVMRQDEERSYWTLVGEAYVHGIMNGECWDESKCRELKVR
ncbi:heterokaryon incompatibility protein-domain-containing protein [Stachybotrys elegans]|uniref:Heterokaryon incompatibility protein-domain-containing protein n=1 Tax=Stachybotrys elegans TaxID=80388 RepID=A0A8K0SP76_9HYPO|nr:heterokaryon incompatibility protein-domain-containing protein [Stachybotrys elegans]